MSNKGSTLMSQLDVDESVIEHHGVKGMKWGVRRGNLKSRVRGAVKDNIHNRRASARAVAEGRARLSDHLSTPGLINRRKNAAKLVKDLDAREDRLRSGKGKVGDILSEIGRLGLSDLFLSYRDTRD